MINPVVSRSDITGWTFTWDPGTPPYQIWLDGRLVTTTDIESYVTPLPGYEVVPPAFEILNDGEVSENETYPPYVVLQWRGISGAINYLVEQFDGVNWVSVANVSDRFAGYYSWTSGVLDDGEVEQYRVTAQDLNGVSGTPIEFTLEVCRNPLVVPVAVYFDSSGNLVTYAY